MKKKLKVVFIIILVLIVIGIVLSTWFKNISQRFADTENSLSDSYFIEHVAKREKLVSEIKGNGTITSFNINKIDMPYEYKIKEKYVNDGEYVTQNKTLMKIETNGVTTNINSPIDGMYFEVADSLGVNNYYVYDLNNIGVETKVKEMDVAKLAIGQKASVKITSLNKEVEGSVTYISKLPTEGTKYKIRISIPYTDDIRFGYGASVSVNIEEKDNVLSIPYNALVMDKDDSYYVVKNNCKYDYYRYKMSDKSTLNSDCKTKVEIGIISNYYVEITSGLEENDVVLEWNTIK